MEEFFVYGLIDPKDNLPFYIGKGKGKRPEVHFKETKENTSNYYKFYVIQQILKSGLEPIILIYKRFEIEQDAYVFEKELIIKFGRRRYEKHGILTNLCLDSNPPNRTGYKESEESKQRKRISNRLNRLGKKASEETKLKISIAKTGKTYENRKLSGPLSEEHKHALRLANKSFYENLNDEERLILSDNLKKRWKTRRNNGNDLHSVESKEKISKTMKGRRANIPKEKVICPHCKKEGGKPAMIRFHFNNCKLLTSTTPT